MRYNRDGADWVTPEQWNVGDQVTLADDDQPWTVRAVTEHFAALARPVTDTDRKAHREAYDEAHWDDDLAPGYEPMEDEVFYTVLDWRNGVRGPCNLVGQGWGDGTYTEAQCAAMLADFERGELEVSHRNWVPIRIAG